MAIKIKEDGGPAFGEFQQAGDFSIKTGGMSLRDYFAAHATDGDIQCRMNDHYTSNWGNEGFKRITRTQARYAHADEMLAERAK